MRKYSPIEKIAIGCLAAFLTGIVLRISVSNLFPSEKDRIISKYSGMSIENIQKAINTPKEAGKFVEGIYGRDSWCFDSSKALAYLIHDDNYDPFPVWLTKEKNGLYWPYHCICTFKRNGKYGAVDKGIFGYMPEKYNSINELVDHIAEKEKIRGLSYSPFMESENKPAKLTVDDFRKSLENLNISLYEKEDMKDVLKKDSQILWKTGKYNLGK